MRNIKTITVTAILIGIISMASCKKDVQLQKENPVVPGATTNFKELKVSPSFDWKSARVVALNVVAAIAPIKITNTLTIKTETGEVIFKKLQNMNDSYTGTLTLPTSLKKVVVSFGSITKTVDIVGDAIHFNFVTESIPIE